MKIAIVGCIHGELSQVYRDIEAIEKRENFRVDLVLICGDVQTLRNENDLKCMAVKEKFRNLGDFHRYYNGDLRAPVLTLFIGGNHEASNYLMTLPYGGWVCPNIFYLGFANVVRFNGLRIAALSGIYNQYHKSWGHFEYLPFDENSKRSIYHTRSLETYRLLQIDNSGEQVDIFLSHDWPLNIHKHGDTNRLLSIKPFFKKDIDNGSLGNPYSSQILEHLKPRYWFSAHLHVRFEATVNHEDGKATQFLALDKCLPRRPYLEIVNIEPKTETSDGLEYDFEWIAILKNSNQYLSIEKIPKIKVPGFWVPLPCDIKKETEKLKTSFKSLKVPDNFEKVSPVRNDKDEDPDRRVNYVNPQTTEFCKKFELEDPIEFLIKSRELQSNPDEIDLSEDDEETMEKEPMQKKLKSDENSLTEEQSFIIDTKGSK
ncbi:hypothetical protein B4U79_11682 [Dinothrombium tinctorium]|uniref:Lariat debranching enzyme C-terminal domain-containing protein n=1 Tax=Dinothrombium tinctorium TaxID=1965070 RepID=A0A3S3SIG8_9ACAR|nr:hypothetical protein B4U79_11682 [Dinothrombium tinctorium]